MCRHVDSMLRGACNLFMGCEFRLPFHLTMQSGNRTYTCDDGTLENSTAIVCQPTCAVVNCSLQTTTYFFATVAMKRKAGHGNGDICVGNCVTYCCEGMAVPATL
jgi:hypothetical protein